MATIIEQSYTISLSLKELSLIKTALSFVDPASDWHELAETLFETIPVDIIHCPSKDELS